MPGIEEYLAEFTDDRAWGEDGYLADKGMIPLDDDTRGEIAEQVASLTTLKSIE